MWRYSRILLLLIGYSAGAGACKAQGYLMPDGTTLMNDSTVWIAVLGANAGHGSSALQNQLVNAFVFGGFIDEAMKDDLTANLDRNNRMLFGYGFNAELAFRPHAKSWALTVCMAQDNLQRIDFSNDAAELIFRGNAHFAERSASIDGLLWREYGWRKFQAGWVHASSGSYAKIGIYQGLARQQWQLKSGSVTTVYRADEAPFAERLDIVVREFESSIALDENDRSTPGIGMGVEAAWVIRRKWGLIEASVADLGLMRWHLSESRDTTGQFSFSGFNLNPEGGNPETSLEQLRDSLLPVAAETGTFTELMPFLSRLRYISPIMAQRYFVNVQVGYRHKFNRLPWADLRACMNYGNGSTVWLSTTASEHAPVQLGLGVQHSLGKLGLCTLHINHLTGMLSNQSRSRSLMLQYILRL